MEEKLQQETVQEAVSVRQPQKSALATAGMVLGIVGIATSFIPIVNNASFVLGILALIFGGIALVKKKLMGKAMTALVLGILSVVIDHTVAAADLRHHHTVSLHGADALFGETARSRPSFSAAR